MSQTTSLASNAANDIFLGPDGNLALVHDIDAVLQNCTAVMETQLGECVLGLNVGVPTDATIWSTWNPVQFEAYGRRNLLTVPHVTAVTSFVVTREDDTASYVAEVMTDFGPLTITGIIRNG